MISLFVKGLYCSRSKDFTQDDLDTISRKVSRYLPTQYDFLTNVPYLGVQCIDEIIRRENISEKLGRTVLMFADPTSQRLPRISFDQDGNVDSVNAEYLKKFLTSYKEFTIGIANFRTNYNDRDKFGTTVDQNSAVASLVAVTSYLKLLQLSDDFDMQLVKLTAKEVMHEFGHLRKLTHHTNKVGCLMDDWVDTRDAFERPEKFCEEDSQKLLTVQ